MKIVPTKSKRETTSDIYSPDEIPSSRTVEAIQPPSIEHNQEEIETRRAKPNFDNKQELPEINSEFPNDVTHREQSIVNQKIFERSITAGSIFPKMPSYNSIAIVLSYVGIDVEVRKLLYQLSRHTRLYFKVHKEILRAFLPAWRSAQVLADTCIAFGKEDSKRKWQGSWPT